MSQTLLIQREIEDTPKLFRHRLVGLKLSPEDQKTFIVATEGHWTGFRGVAHLEVTTPEGTTRRFFAVTDYYSGTFPIDQVLEIKQDVGSVEVK